jgi:hypothetical protein
MAISTAAASNDPITGALGLRPGEHFIVTNQLAKPHAALRYSMPQWFCTARLKGEATSACGTPLQDCVAQRRMAIGRALDPQHYRPA